MSRGMKNNQRRQKGTGCIFKRGKFFYLKYTVNDKNKTISLNKTTKREDAELEAKKYLSDISAKTKEEILFHIGEARKVLKRNTIFISESWQIFERSKKRPYCNKHTLMIHKSYWNRFINWLPANIKHIGQITPDIADTYMNYLWNDKSVSERTYNAFLLSLRMIHKILDENLDNPFASIKKKSEKTFSHKEFTEDEVKQIFYAFDEKDYKLLPLLKSESKYHSEKPKLLIMNKEEMKVMFHLGCWTGLRLKDCALLEWDAVNFNRNIISVIPYKTEKHNARVMIPMHPILSKELTALSKTSQYSKYVLAKIANRYLYNPSGVRKDCIKVLRYCGFETSVKVPGRQIKVNQYGFHSFRHSFVSFCANAGVPMAIVQSIVGHGSPAMTKHYTHIGTETLNKAVLSLPNFDNNIVKNDLQQLKNNIQEIINNCNDAKILKKISDFLI